MKGWSKKFSEEDRIMWWRLYARYDLSVREIAAKYDCSGMTVYRELFREPQGVMKTRKLGDFKQRRYNMPDYEL